tara:strand:- start:1379 stop:2218 length:840 start_codon:yes stop_codon:yes gene_type:complete
MLSSLQRNFIPSLIKNIKKALFISLLFYCYNCEKNNSSSGLILARVKDKELSIEKLEKDLKPKQRSVNQIKNYINDWVNQTLLFEEAKKENLHNDIFLNEMKNKYFKRLVSETFLETKTFLPDLISQDEIKKYYEKHKLSFSRSNEEALVYHFSVSSNNEALIIQRKLKRKKSGVVLDSLFAKHSVSLKKIKKGRVPQKTNNHVFDNEKIGVLKPFMFLDKFHVIEVVKRYKKGSVVGLDDAYDEIYQRIIKQKQLTKKTKVLDSLKNAYNVFINSEYN